MSRTVNLFDALLDIYSGLLWMIVELQNATERISSDYPTLCGVVLRLEKKVIAVLILCNVGLCHGRIEIEPSLRCLLSNHKDSEVES